MKGRSAAILLASATLGVALVAALIRVSRIDLHLTWHQLRNASPIAFVKLVALNFLMVAVSTEKWRSVDAALRTQSDLVPPRSSTFAVTSAGLALGLLLPTQLGMAASRTLGTSFYGKPFSRGAAGTLFEQSFDVFIVFFLAVASGVTWFYRGSAAMWFTCAAAMVGIAVVAAGQCARLAQFLASRAAHSLAPDNRVGMQLRGFVELANSRVLDPALAHRLMLLSALRFFVVALMAEETAQAIGTDIAVWQMAAVVPFSVLTTVLSITPGGVGVSELASVSGLREFGIPLAVAGPWALANRVLATASCFIVAIGASIVLVVAGPRAKKPASAPVRPVTDKEAFRQSQMPRLPP
jgi:uncharacterized protein (TIRG00374 family)